MPFGCFAVCHTFHCHASTHQRLSVCGFMFGIVYFLMDSHKATSIAAIVWLACYPHSAAWLLRPSGHGFCSALHACQRSDLSHKHLLSAQKAKTHASHLCLQHILSAALLRRANASSTSFGLATASGAASANRSASLHYLQPLLLTPAQGCFTAQLSLT